MNSDKLVIRLAGNDEIKEYLAKKAPGDRCKFEVDAALDEMTPEQAIFSIKETNVISDHQPVEPAESEGGSGKGEEEPVMAALVGKKY